MCEGIEHNRLAVNLYNLNYLSSIFWIDKLKLYQSTEKIDILTELNKINGDNGIGVINWTPKADKNCNILCPVYLSLTELLLFVCNKQIPCQIHGKNWPERML